VGDECVCRDGYCGLNQDSAPTYSVGHENLVDINIGAHWTSQHWAIAIAGENAINPAYPWNAGADTILHEFSHSHGYEHPEDPGVQEGCADDAGLASYFQCGEPSMPYIISQCAAAAVDAVFASEESIWDCGPDMVKLPFGYDPTANAILDPTTLAAAYSSGTVCVRSNRHRVFFRTGTGHYFQAYNRGGSGFSAASVGPGDWEALTVIDHNGGTLVSGDEISIKTPNYPFVRVSPTGGGLVRADALSDAGTETRFIISKVSGSGAILPGAQITLRSVSRGTFVTAVNNGGGSLVSDAAVASTWERFVFERPRRAHLINLRTTEFSGAAATANAFDPTVTASAADAVLSTRLETGVGQPAAIDEAWWVYDHNGGQLLSGDTVSFERAASGPVLFLSTCTSGTSGNVRGDGWYAGNCARFVITREAGYGAINRNDRITLRSVSNNRFLTWVPNSFPDPALRRRVRHDAVAAGAWERFRFMPVQGAAFTVE
jgi:hypothetical protein